NTLGAQDENAISDLSSAGAGHNATRSGSISGNSISDIPGLDSDGIIESLSAGGTATSTMTIEKNAISNMGGYGIDVENDGTTAQSASSVTTIEHNTLNRIGLGGIDAVGIEPTITANKITSVGLAGESGIAAAGIYVNHTPGQGSVTCNLDYGNPRGVDYGVDNPASGASGHNGDPKTNDNSFKDPSSSNRNSTDISSDNAGVNPTDAQSNYWGGTPRLYPPTTRYDTSPTLTTAAKCVATAGA
ncbi:MAG TPA: hypothetical protein VGF84_23730, partial [Micromonosporaceae bacterium]